MCACASVYVSPSLSHGDEITALGLRGHRAGKPAEWREPATGEVVVGLAEAV